jgi:carboxymethylenebutenolidase
MGYMERYVAEEHAGDYFSGRISYQELVRRLTLLTGTLGAALLLAATLGCTAAAPTSIPSTPTPAAQASTATPIVESTAARPDATSTAPPAGAATATVTAGSSPAADPTATTRVRGVTVPPDDPAITAGDVTFEHAGVTLMGYLAQPKAPGPHPAVLIIHENRGLTAPHFPDVARRLAKEGYVALALDLLSREGGTANLPDPGRASALLGQAGAARLVEDMNGGVRYLQGLTAVRPDRVGAIGFCFGGGMVWLLCTQSPDLRAAAPFYGPRPPLVDVANIRAHVLGVYAANDTRINAGVPDLEAALKANNKSYRLNTYPNAGHAFFNDTGGAYNSAAAQQAWRDTLDWFGQYLKA